MFKGLPDQSIGYSIFSPPFASLYTYSNSPRDMGKVVAAVKEKAAGRADMGVVSGKIKARLAG